MDAGDALFLSAPIVGAVVSYRFWCLEARDPQMGRWKAAAFGLLAGTLGWPAAIGTIWAISVILFRIAAEALWIFVLLVTWTPGRG